MRILVVRNDKLGDFILAWPALALLKQNLPGLHLSVLVPRYTAPMAELCPWVDRVVIDEGSGGGPGDLLALRHTLRTGNYDALLTLFSTGRVALAGCLAAIPFRLAPATKLAQLCYTRRLKQNRSSSDKPEYAYNIDLAAKLLAHFGRAPAIPFGADRERVDWLPRTIQRPLIDVGPDRRQALRSDLCARHAIPADSRLVVIHPGSGGSSANLTLGQYGELARRIAQTPGCAILITVGPGEQPLADGLLAQMGGERATLIAPGSLNQLVDTLAAADLFISGSTGPLHIAGALNIATAAFYSCRRSANRLRWQSLNAPDRRLTFSPDEQAAENAMLSINIAGAARTIIEHFLSGQSSTPERQ